MLVAPFLLKSDWELQRELVTRSVEWGLIWRGDYTIADLAAPNLVNRIMCWESGWEASHRDRCRSPHCAVAGRRAMIPAIAMPEAGLAFSDAELAAYVAVARCESAVLLNERLNLSRQTFSAVVEPLPPQQLVCVDPERVREIWPFVAPLLKQAIAKTGLAAFATVERDILDGSSLLWVAWNGGRIAAVASTSVQQTDAGKVCVITACAGAGMALWLPLIRGIEAYAQAEDCCCVRIFGRRGWSRILEGYEQTFAIMDKRLPQEVTPAPDVSPIAEATYLR